MNLTDQNVCIVSYAEYMHNNNMGSRIDSYDVVVRLNNGIHTITKRDFGVKNTIASFTISRSKIDIIERSYKLLKKEKIDFLQICKKYGFDLVIGFINQLEIDYWSEYLESNKYDFDCITKLNNQYEFLSDMGLTCGLSTIIFILKQKPKKLFICGFDFTMNMHPDYSKFYPIPERIGKTYDDIQSNWHSTIFEKYIFKRLFLRYNFDVDEKLLQILKDFSLGDLDDKTYFAEFKEVLNFRYKYKIAFESIVNYIDR